MISALLDFWDALGVIVLLIVFIMLYNMFYPSIVSSQLVALVLVAVITFLVVIPYPWFKYLLFCFLFMYGFFQTFKPYEW